MKQSKDHVDAYIRFPKPLYRKIKKYLPKLKVEKGERKSINTYVVKAAEAMVMLDEVIEKAKSA